MPVETLPRTTDRTDLGGLDLPGFKEDDLFPTDLFVLWHGGPPHERYGCYCHEGLHGLACFTNIPAAVTFARWIGLTGMVAIPVTFEGAREIAKERPQIITALFLMDSPNAPSKIHYVR